MPINGSSNPSLNGERDVSVVGSKTFGGSDNFTGKFFAAGNTKGGPGTLGVGADYANNGHGLGLSASHTSGVGSQLVGSGHVNVLSTPKHNVDAFAFHEINKLNHGPSFTRSGGGLDYNNASGFGGTLTGTRTPLAGSTTVDLAARANLWTSSTGAGRLDATANTSRSFGGMNHGSSSHGGGLSFRHNF